ncbi:MAG: putative rane protein [Patescibacteria group bacterium]|nr:putative rane protein [Patescibacteria group bacterium]
MFKEFINEVKKATSSTYLKIALVAVMLVPLLYGAIYLKAFWDPYANIDQVPVAVVNLDKGYNDNNKKVNIGDELITTLNNDDNLKWNFVTADEAQKGLDQKRYYASLTIPTDFSAKIYSIDSDKPQSTALIYRSREATNYLATTITNNVSSKVTDTLSHKITAKYLSNIFLDLKDTATELTKAKDASIQLVKGLSSTNNGVYSLHTGLANLNLGNDQIKSGLTTLNNKQNEFTNGLASAITGTDQLKIGAENVSDGITKGQGALKAYLITNPSAATNPYIIGLSSALTASNAGQAKIISGLETMTTHLSSAKNGSAALADGSKQLLSGSNDLSDGISKLSNGTTELSTGLTKIEDGASKLSDSLSDGADKATAKSDDKKTAVQTNIMSEPITMDTNSYDLVSNYGSGFAPYFISLALWVGSLLSFFVIDFTKKPKSKKETIMKSTILAVLGITQSTILGLVLQHSLGLSVANPWQFYGFIGLISLTFMALIQLLIQHLDNVGRYIAIVLLILQLTSAAGTFPKETLPAFFQIVNPILPMTYSVSGLRDILYTNELSNLWIPLAYFVGILVICLTTNLILTKNLYKKA